MPTQLSKGMLARIRNGYIHGALDFQFNPTTINRSGSVDWIWGQGPGALLPVATFGKVGELAISLRLLFDARENYDPKLGGLRGVLAEAEAMALPKVDRWQSKRNVQAVAPDQCRLVFGARSWQCEVKDWSIDEEVFAPNLDPVRARVAYNLRLINNGFESVQRYIDSLRVMRERYEDRGLPAVFR